MGEKTRNCPAWAAGDRVCEDGRPGVAVASGRSGRPGVDGVAKRLAGLECGRRGRRDGDSLPGAGVAALARRAALRRERPETGDGDGVAPGEAVADGGEERDVRLAVVGAVLPARGDLDHRLARIPERDAAKRSRALAVPARTGLLARDDRVLRLATALRAGRLGAGRANIAVRNRPQPLDHVSVVGQAGSEEMNQKRVRRVAGHCHRCRHDAVSFVPIREIDGRTPSPGRPDRRPAHGQASPLDGERRADGDGDGTAAGHVTVGGAGGCQREDQETR